MRGGPAMGWRGLPACLPAWLAGVAGLAWPAGVAGLAWPAGVAGLAWPAGVAP